MHAAESAVRGLSAPVLVARLAALLAGMVGLVALAGWITDIQALRSLVPGYATVKANTAVCFLLSAAGLWLAAGERAAAGRIPAILAAVIALLTLGEYAAGIDLRIDQLLFRDPDPMSAPFPGRMSIPTATNFILFGAAMLLPRQASPAADLAFTALCSIGLIETILVLIGYGYGIPLLYRPHPGSSIAVHTAMTFAALFVGALATRPEVGWAAMLRSDRAGGAVARRMLPFVVLLPPLLGWAVLQGERHGLYDTATAIALFAIISLMIFAAVGWSSSHVVDRLDVVRRRTEAALVASESLFLAFVQNAPFVTYMKDRDGRYVFHNPEGERVFKATDAVLRGKAAGDFHDPATAAEIAAIEQRIIASGQPTVVEKRTSAAGPYEWVMVIKFPIRDATGTIIGVGGFDIDISERKRAEMAAHEREESYRRVLDLVQEAIWIHTDGKVVFANPAAARLFGVDRPEALVGQSAMGWVHPQDREHAAARTRILTAQPCAVPVTEMSMVGLDGQVRTAAIHAVSFLQDGKMHIMASARDVTQQRQAEAQLTQAQKMEAVGQLTGGVAHDFNNLLTAIIGYTDVVFERNAADDATKRDVQEIRKAADRAASLTRQLLAFGRKQFLRPVVLDLNETVSELLQMLPRVIGENMHTVTRLEQGLFRVTADPSQMEQVLVNLVLNARDAMPTGGTITIETSNVELTPPRLEADGVTLPPGPYVMLAVSDTGTGMDAKTRAHAFEPFFTTKPKGKGTGLGLATVYGIVDQTGGAITIKTAVGHGTTVRIYLPAVSAPAEKREPDPTTTKTFGTESIMLVEDNDAVRELAIKTLRQRGYTVIEASSAEEAIDLVARGAQAQLLLTDVVMPGLSGPNLAARLLQHNPRMRVLYMSGYSEDAAAAHGTFWGGVPLLQKPFTPSQLAERVRIALDTATGPT